MNSLHDELQNQINSIIDEDIDDSSEKYQKLKDILKWDKYVDENIDLNPKKSQLYNPAIEFYLENIGWNDSGWKSFSNTDNPIIYPEYIPSDKIIKYLCNEKDILEIGAGSGYWSHVINTNGGNSQPTDKYPQHQEYDENIDGFPVAVNARKEYPEFIWSSVDEKDHTIISEYPNKDILFCHPEGFTWTEEVLKLMKTGQKLILIAAWYPSPNATPFFFKELTENWTLEKQLPVYSVESNHAQMYEFVKN